METRMILIRHGETGYPNGTFVGRTDVGLADGAFEEAANLGRRLRPEGIRTVYTSALKRACETGDAIARALGMEVSGRLEGVNEIDFGDFEMMWKGDIMEKHPDDFARRKASLWTYDGHNMESWGQVRDRAMPVVGELMKKHEGETFAVVSHGVTIRVIYATLMGMEPGEVNRNTFDFLCAVFFKKQGDKIGIEKEWGV